jgi:hypothetical protein
MHECTETNKYVLQKFQVFYSESNVWRRCKYELCVGSRNDKKTSRCSSGCNEEAVGNAEQGREKRGGREKERREDE